MSRNEMTRRGACKTLLAIGGVAMTGLARAQSTRSGTAPEDSTALQDERVADAVRRGATMEEIAQLREPLVRTPEEALRMLKTGNARFFGGEARRPELSAAERRAQILGQSPFAVVLGCSDSRVPTEIVFDQSLGSLFITRVAGNIVDTPTVGSIEYAVGHLNTRLVVVMGHEGCGAVKAALLPAADRARETPAIQALLNQIVPSVANLPTIRDEKAKMREAVIANVRLQVAELKQEPAIQAALAANRIGVVGAYYEITSGAVDFLETAEELRLTSSTLGRTWRAHLGQESRLPDLG